MQHIGEVVSRTLPALAPSNGAGAPDTQPDDPGDCPRTLHDLVKRFEADEAEQNPDVVLPTSSLRTPDGHALSIPKLGTFGFTEWSRQQCASILGVRLDRWFENASTSERADELNRRFARASGTVRIRTSRKTAEDHGDGTLRAFVSPGYSAVADSMLARMLVTVLTPADPELRIVRSDVTDRTVSYVVKVGDKFRPGDAHEVGDLWGGLLVRNSGVGFASLIAMLHLTRLLCKNGMTAPVPNAVLLRKRHRAIDEGALRALLVEQLDRLPERLARGADLLRSSRRRSVANIEAELTALLNSADLPRRHVPALMSAYAAEPEPTAFGVVQAVTRAAQAMTPELRLQLEQAAGAYIAQA